MGNGLLTCLTSFRDARFRPTNRLLGSFTFLTIVGFGVNLLRIFLSSTVRHIKRYTVSFLIFETRGQLEAGLT